MDAQSVDQEFAQLQQQGQQTLQLVQGLASKLKAAADAGDQNAREYALDLREIAIAIRDEESQVSKLLQSIHGLVDNHVQQSAQPQQVAPQPQYAPPPQPQYQQPQYQQPQYQQPMYQQQQGGMLQRFLGGGFGRAIATGAGFGIGDTIATDVIDDIF
ncbi:MAG: hypothetical protein J2P18_19655 [Nocardia sp.]|nr:hypothetical protein [Nocardia sp.]